MTFIFEYIKKDFIKKIPENICTTTIIMSQQKEKQRYIISVQKPKCNIIERNIGDFLPSSYLWERIIWTTYIFNAVRGTLSEDRKTNFFVELTNFSLVYIRYSHILNRYEDILRDIMLSLKAPGKCKSFPKCTPRKESGWKREQLTRKRSEHR